MKVFVSSLNIPIGYSTPRFPSLYLPLGPFSRQYLLSFLYYSFDVWKYTVFWYVIVFGAAYLAVGLVAGANLSLNRYRFTHFKNKTSNSNSPYKHSIFNLVVVALYVVLGTIQGFLSGSIVGVLLLAIYKAGLLSMSTWIPFCWAIAGILYHICTLYRASSLLL